MDTPSREAQPKPIDRESVKTLAIAVGVRQAARQLGLNEDRVLKWSERGKWFKTETKPQPPTVTKNDVITVITPSESLKQTLEDDCVKTKIGLSRATRSAAEEFSQMDGQEVILTSGPLKDVVAAASRIHGWEKPEAGAGASLHLSILAQAAQVNVSSD